MSNENSNSTSKPVTPPGSNTPISSRSPVRFVQDSVDLLPKQTPNNSHKK